MLKLAPNGSETTIGFGNASRLLMSLASGGHKGNGSLTDLQNCDAEQDNLGSYDIVKDLFNRLDVDGDGAISWWEWKSVLTASLSNREGNNPSKFIDPIDPLLISAFAASEALAVTNCSINASSNQKFFEEI